MVGCVGNGKQCSCQACKARLGQHVRNHSIHITPRGSCGVNRTSGRDTTPDTTMPMRLNFQRSLRSKSPQNTDMHRKSRCRYRSQGLSPLAPVGTPYSIFGCWAWALWQLCSGLPKYWMTASQRIQGCRRSSKERCSCRALSCQFTPHGPPFCKPLHCKRPQA